MEMMEEAEVPDASDDTEKTDSDGGQDEEEEEEDEYRCKHYRRKCQFVVSANWFVFVYIISVVFVVFIIFKSHGPP